MVNLSIVFGKYGKLFLQDAIKFFVNKSSTKVESFEAGHIFVTETQKINFMWHFKKRHSCCEFIYAL